MSKEEQDKNSSQGITAAAESKQAGNLSDEDLDKVAGGGEPIEGVDTKLGKLGSCITNRPLGGPTTKR